MLSELRVYVVYSGKPKGFASALGNRPFRLTGVSAPVKPYGLSLGPAGSSRLGLDGLGSEAYALESLTSS